MSAEDQRQRRSEHEQQRGAAQEWIEQVVEIEDPLGRRDRLLTFLDGEDSIYKSHFPTTTGIDSEPAQAVLRALAGMRITKYPAPGEIILQANADLLALQPDETPLGTNPQRVLYNTITLAQGLPDATNDIAVDSIEGMYRRGKLAGSYKEQDLGQELLWAMTTHQPDPRYKQVWEDALDERDTSFIPISPRKAFDGLVMVAESKETLGSPHLETIGPSFLKFAEYIRRTFGGEDAWREEFGWGVNVALNTYPGRPKWPRELGMMTKTPGWERWMVEVADRVLWENTRQHIVFPSETNSKRIPSTFRKGLKEINLDPTS